MLTLPCLVALLAGWCPPQEAGGEDDLIVLHAKMHHLGDSRVKTWPGVPEDPEGSRLEFTFRAKASTKLRCLVVRHLDADNVWWIVLNGKRIGRLKKNKKEARDFNYVVPANTLRDGRNKLSFEPTRKTDDILIGNVRLHRRPFREVFHLRPVRVRVRDADGRALPARITITSEANELVPVYFGTRKTTAVRPGIVYTSSGDAQFEIPRGRYRFHAGRGSEWSLGAAQVTVANPAGTELDFRLTRTVDTTGYVACDTHIHTLEHSGHGDASERERLVTLAGEGVELAIATDHNHNIDYRPKQRKLGLTKHFTSVVGNEVTTKLGHFNAFPLNPKDKVPEYRLTDWVKILAGIRKKGARVVILNHPRWPDLRKGPFGQKRLNRISGERATGPRKLTFDAMELANSGALLPDPLYLFRDWFALLNHGETIFAVGSSDSHTVGYPVGQGRTYVRSKTDDPARIDVDAACDAFLTGRTSISLGIFCDIWVDEKYGLGDTVPVDERKVAVRLRVAAPAWITPQLARVFVNGTEVARRSLEPNGEAMNQFLRFEISTPAHDAWLVCVVTGKPVNERFWKIEAPYSMAATNPVWLDVDHNGKYESPRTIAERLVGRVGLHAKELGAALVDQDDAVAVQALAVVRRKLPLRGRNARLREFASRLRPTRPVLQRYVDSLGQAPATK